MRNIALFLTYEGTAYHGWQMQKNLATVQETMERPSPWWWDTVYM